MNPNDALDDFLGWRKLGFTLGAARGGIELWAHRDSGYRGRTAANASCDATMAVAADYSTGGERLTKQAAGARYIALPLYLEPDEAGSRLAQFMRDKSASSLNVAGNGLYTLNAKGWDQDGVDQWIFDCLARAHALRPVARLQSGGQTGADLAGAIGAARLGIGAKILFPAQFKQRDESGRDAAHDPKALLELIFERSARLLPFPRQEAQQEPPLQDPSNPASTRPL